MNEIIYKYISYKSEEFKEVIDLRFNVLFAPYNKVEKYDYDEFDNISLHLVAINKKRVVGYSRMTDSDGFGKITNVVVNPEYANMGIGFQMMKKHIYTARDNNMKSLCLNARLDTVEFYKKVGFCCKNGAFLSEKSGLMLQDMYYIFE